MKWGCAVKISYNIHISEYIFNTINEGVMKRLHIHLSVDNQGKTSSPEEIKTILQNLNRTGTYAC